MDITIEPRERNEYQIMNPENQEYNFVKVYSTFRQQDFLLAKLALDQEGIPYDTRNENFAALNPGADGPATVDIFVNQSDTARAGEILKPFIEGKIEK